MMMDFDLAASRLQKDQQSALARSRAQRAARTSSAKAKREAEKSRAEAEKRLKEKKFDTERKARLESKVSGEIEKVERELGVVNVGTKVVNDAINPLVVGKTLDVFAKCPLATGWKLNPTSIHGEGDKIALPPSILEELTSSANSDLDPWAGQSGRPLAFRVGILNPDYTGFPSSDKMKGLVEKVNTCLTMNNKKSTTILEETSRQASKQFEEDMDDSDDEIEISSWKEAYLHELSHRYLAYTHSTVVEFTQDDGCVGLPEPIARALLIPNAYSLVENKSNSVIATKRTVDPANMDESKDNRNINVDPIDVENTPGHLAYGKFDIPDTSVEISPIKSLPAGKDCTFTPTVSSIQNGFYALKDIKLVLEQSLTRTRATLSRGDVIRTWRRGVSFDLIVSKISPPEYGVVSCVNTDLNVDIGPPEEMEDKAVATSNSTDEYPKINESIDRTLAEPSQPSKDILPCMPKGNEAESVELPPEPPETETEGVCVVQIRGKGSNSSKRRRFRTSTTTIGDLFTFASSIGEHNSASFRLVTRFPRKVFSLSTSGEENCYNADVSLENAGIVDEQVMFMIEKI